MNLRFLAAALALTACPAMATTCTQTFNLGALGPPGVASFGNSFTSSQGFNDCYNFTLDSSASSMGLTLEWDLAWLRDIDVASVSLSGGSIAGVVVDNTPSSFSFSNLLEGDYTLAVAGAVTGWNVGAGRVGYVGALVAAPVAEPETFAMLAMGLGAVAWKRRRRTRHD